ncbi:hypothetical protein J5Z55_29145 (plasmid) [Priestia aryabhattai]|nr:hypothetical protein J5Z55_29145 [Priestia aryabhattai]
MIFFYIILTNHKEDVKDVYHGLRGVTCTETKISHINEGNGKLIYRRHDVNYLTKNHIFEEVAYLLWHSELPNDQQLAIRIDE